MLVVAVSFIRIVLQRRKSQGRCYPSQTFASIIYEVFHRAGASPDIRRVISEVHRERNLYLFSPLSHTSLK